MRVALVHDYLTHFGGGERVLAALMELFPHAPVYTLVHDRLRSHIFLDERRLRTSNLQKLPWARRAHRYVPLGLMPFAVEQFDLHNFDVVLSAGHAFSKGVITAPHTLHISYCYTPTRYAWDNSHRYAREFSRSRFFQRFSRPALSYIRLWDYYASTRVDSYVTLSQYVADRIQKYYHRDAAVIAPPVDVDQFVPTKEDRGYYLVVSRLVPYKRVDVAIAACEALGRPLKVVGTGPELKDLQSIAGKWTEFLGFVPDKELPALYAGARALLFPQEEDFGITPLEAAASGKPTIAFAAGGALETVIPNTTGLLFSEQTAQALRRAIEQFEAMQWDYQAISEHANMYQKTRFLQEMGDFVQNEWMSFQEMQSL